ncbi:hypothetical protein [Paraburkholderia dinghuensis]|uniref:Peptide-binding protein n=1 Tax=Paraburkholderia dinghuensis TaxID=2305225 RepID=A0A3N6PXK8_9BURK|nr:hypothetical protein [Paraburkholderia dinghuensis]RQH04736.1 hypothetical protein D1Y85_17790 [Paraburkholderia dinghuensis]
MGRWVFGAGLMALVALAHAQPAYSSAHAGGGFQRTPMASPSSGGAGRGGMPWAGRERGAWGAREPAPTRREAAYGGGSGRYAAGPMHVADQGGLRERGGRSAGRVNGQPDRATGGGYGIYRNGPITPVSEPMRPVPHPPADSPVRAGSIREDVARYNEERGSFRPVPRGGGEVPRPPMPSPYRN